MAYSRYRPATRTLLQIHQRYILVTHGPSDYDHCRLLLLYGIYHRVGAIRYCKQLTRSVGSWSWTLARGAWPKSPVYGRTPESVVGHSTSLPPPNRPGAWNPFM